MTSLALLLSASLLDPATPTPIHAAGLDDVVLYEPLGRIDPAQIDDQGIHVLSLMGREDLAIAHRDYERGTCPTDPTADPMALILERAAQTRIVIINEQHTRSRSRLTTAQLIPALHDLGYRHLALEAFSNPPSDTGSVTLKDGKPRELDGGYTREPTFAAVLREAGERGWQFHAYEIIHDEESLALSPLDRTNRREQAQANNLVRVLAAMPADEKLLIHVGYSHGMETPYDLGEDGTIHWMGLRLAAATGIDPLTISQVDCVHDGSGLRLVTDPDRQREGYDLTVAIPAERLVEGRPAHRVEAMGLEPRAIPTAWRPATGWHVIEVRGPGMGLDEVPLDRIAIHASETTLPAYLVPAEGDHEVRIIAVADAPGD
ncbi:hypothetical protein [Sphingomicrobium arenosum]|uniref:hypothetical protein n=1 Tax=Sphingomicrobium arenosum TaxID=2233861 RepID=UPI00224104A5|nr:hypothetical protein [Sphingomicrobium arenosum]